MKVFFLLITAFAMSKNVDAIGPILTFHTDYCTNSPEGTFRRPELWKHCCLIHDLYFWSGGSRKDRDEAEKKLKSCVSDMGAHRVAQLMFIAVRAGSYSPIKYSKKKWNHGWKDRPDFLPLAIEDIDLIESELTQEYEYIPNKIKDDFIWSLYSRLE